MRRFFVLVSVVLGVLWSSLLLGCASSQPEVVGTDVTPPIVFVHGNGDSAALWQTTLWRFESHGWPRERLHAIDLPFPLARDDDGKAQAGRTSTQEHMLFLKAEVEKVLQRTGAHKVVLVANSRGGNAVRNYIANGGGAAVVSHAILGGTPNHGIWAIGLFRPGSEFNGLGSFLTQLNAPKGLNGAEVTPKVQWLTLRSDNNDKYAQPDGAWIGAKGTETHVGYDSPELKGASNVVLERADHRETAFSPEAFAHMLRFITGKAVSSNAIVPEASVALSGRVTGLGLDSNDPKSGAFTNNLPLVNAQLAVFAVDRATGARVSEAPHYSQTIGADGQWGPFAAQSGVAYEFVVTAAGYATTHIYRNPFPRSSSVVHLRPERLADTDKEALAAKSIVTLSRPRGYFDATRDRVSFDGQTPAPGLPPIGAGVSTSRVLLKDDASRAISGEFNGEKITGRTWPAVQGHVSILELTY